MPLEIDHLLKDLEDTLDVFEDDLKTLKAIGVDDITGVLEKRIDEFYAPFYTRVDQIEEALDTLSQEVEDWEAYDFSSIDPTLEGFSSEVIAEKEKIGELIEAAAGTLEERLSSIEERFDAFLDEVEGKMDALDEALETEAAMTLTSVNRRLAEDLTARLAAQHAGLIAGLTTLSSGIGERFDVIDEHLGGVLDKTEEIVNMIEQVRPILDQVEFVLS